MEGQIVYRILPNRNEWSKNFDGRSHDRGAPPLPTKMHLSLGDLGPPPNTWFLGQTQVHTLNDTSTGLAVFVGLVVVQQLETNRQAHIHRDHSTSAAIVRIFAVHACKVA